MLNNEAAAAEAKILLSPQSLSAGANTGTWVPVSNYEGDLLFTCAAGAITGNVVFKVQSADDASGTSAADVTGAALSAMSTGDEIGTIVVKKSAIGNAYCTVVATVTTGPVLASAVLEARRKNF